MANRESRRTEGEGDKQQTIDPLKQAERNKGGFPGKALFKGSFYAAQVRVCLQVSSLGQWGSIDIPAL